MTILADLLQEAAGASGPTVIEKKVSPVGGVDPLGLRQVNFDLMDQILPGLNNVADRVRPFVLVTWAWRRVRQILAHDGRSGAADQEMRDFVDRIEAIYSWSQFLINPNAGIPGAQALAELISGEAESYRFGDDAWIRRRDLRRTSTGLISPLNYGPGLRSMGWLVPSEYPGVFGVPTEFDPMLDAFESRFADILGHDAFNRLGDVTVAREDVRRWGAAWALDDVTEEECAAVVARLCAHPDRRNGLRLIEAALSGARSEKHNIGELRARMAAAEGVGASDMIIVEKAAAWRLLQTRQLFRLGLEALFQWLIITFEGGLSLRSEALAERFIRAAAGPEAATGRDWFTTEHDNPVLLLDHLATALQDEDGPLLADLIRQALAFSLAEKNDGREGVSQASDRLPVARAKSDFERWQHLPLRQCLVNIIEVWVLAQHAYWCVGRGLADARSRGKTLLRLRIIMDEGGWTLTPGAGPGNPPTPTPDRLETAVALLSECGRLSRDRPVHQVDLASFQG